MASALITGTSKGIGFETALAFARAGHTVFATMRNPAASPELAQIATREQLPIHIYTMDVDSDSSVSAAIAAIRNDHGPIDILVNNAGIDRAGSIEESPLSDFRLSMETNFFGALRCIQALIPEMRKRRSGCIINITSVGGLLTNPPLSAYASSKWALEALSEALASEMRPFNVRVAIIEPGIIDTAMARRIADSADNSAYPHRARFAAMFSTSLQNALPPAAVATKILDVASSGNQQLRHLVGADAAALLNWRRKMSDEEWIELHASDDAVFFQGLQQAFAAAPQPETEQIKA